MDSMLLRLSLVICVLGLGTLAPSRASAEAADHDWHVAATIYGWFPDIGGETNFPADPGNDINVDISTILDHLKMTAQGSFEVRKGSWGVFTDVVYLDVGEAKSQTRNLEINGQPLPAAITADLDFDLKSVFWTLAGTYRVAETPDASMDVLLGVRLASMQQTLDWEFAGTFVGATPPPLTGTRESKVDQWDGVFGIRGRLAFGAEHKWIVPYYFDIGAGDSDMTWQGMLGLAYAFNWGDVGVAWRYLDYDLKSGEAIADMNFNGPALGATFRW